MIHPLSCNCKRCRPVAPASMTESVLIPVFGALVAVVIGVRILRDLGWWF